MSTAANVECASTAGDAESVSTAADGRSVSFLADSFTKPTDSYESREKLFVADAGAASSVAGAGAVPPAAFGHNS